MKLLNLVLILILVGAVGVAGYSYYSSKVDPIPVGSSKQVTCDVNIHQPIFSGAEITSMNCVTSACSWLPFSITGFTGNVQLEDFNKILDSSSIDLTRIFSDDKTIKLSGCTTNNRVIAKLYDEDNQLVSTKEFNIG